MSNIEALRQRYARAKEKICSILAEGEYTFRVKEAKWEWDDKRKYEYLFAKLLCTPKTTGEQILTTDRFPITDDADWKFFRFLEALGTHINELKDVKELIDRRATLVAEKQKNGKTFYNYRKEEIAA